jgi:thiamine pyrophosphate-dependent acetolactate synthase large subunit-like protein
VDFAAVARCAGVSQAETVTDAADIHQALQRLLQNDGLALVALHVDTAFQPYGAAPEWSVGEEKHQFQLRLAAERAAVQGSKR